MIKQLSNGSYRVRYNYGHNKRYQFLSKLAKPTVKQIAEKTALEDKFGIPVDIKTRRSVCVKHEWHAQKIEQLYRAAHELEAEGRPVPKKLLEIDKVPESRLDYLDELSYGLASVCGFHEDLVGRMDYAMFLEQMDANQDWVDNFNISESDVRDFAKFFCVDTSSVDLKNKNYLFIGAVTGFTGCEPYLNCLKNLARELKVDGIITVGDWVKTIFLNKTAKQTEILPALRKLAEEVKIYAIRSSKDAPDMLHELKKIGITFLNGIEDDKNVFTGIRLHRNSTRDQLSRFEESHCGKNVFVHSTYVGLRSQSTGEGGDLRYLVGSGSSGYNTPSARFWAGAYDGQLFNSENRDSIGGHVLRFDGEANVYPTTFRYNPDIKAILYGGKAYKQRAIVNGKLHLILSDFHAGSHDHWAFTSLLKFIDEHREEISTFVINGDFFSNTVLSHHNNSNLKEQVRIALRDMDFLKEVAFTRACIDAILSRLAVTTKLIYKKGNHEVNSFNSFVKRDINIFLESFLDLDRLLNLSELGFTVIDSKESYKVKDINIHHGHEMARRTARKTFGPKNARGHSHGIDIGPDGVSLSGMEKKEKAGYLPHVYQRWTLGYATITEVENQVVLPQPILVRDGKYGDFDGIRELEDTFEVELPDSISLSYPLEWTGKEEL